MQFELTTEQRAILLSLVWREEANVQDSDPKRLADLHVIEDILLNNK